MPIIILGLVVAICVLIYAIARYMNSGEDDSRTVRERYPHIFTAKDGAGQEPDSDEPLHPETYVDSDSFVGDLQHMARGVRDDIRNIAARHGIDLDAAAEAMRRSRDQEDDEDSSGDSKTIQFPTGNVEEEKRKRNIH